MIKFTRLGKFGQTYELEQIAENRTKITYQGNHIIVNYSADYISQGWYDWQMRGQHIQTAFSLLTPAQREFILTGMTEDEWKELWGEK